jgi:hypothetical protein
MKVSRFSEEQIIHLLQQADCGEQSNRIGASVCETPRESGVGVWSVCHGVGNDPGG